MEELFGAGNPRIGRKQLLALWSSSDAAWSNTSHARLRLADALNRLQAQGVIELPARDGQLWDSSLTPLPHRITVPANRSEIVRALDPASEPWVPELKWAAGWIRAARPPQRLRWAAARINKWLLTTHGKLRHRVAREERSLHIFDDEKQLAILAATALFADDRLSLDDLACDRPIGGLRIARFADFGRVLVVENKSTFDSVWRALSASSIEHNYAAVVFGAGDAVAALAPELAQLPQLCSVTPTILEYAGDVDTAGVQAAYAFADSASKAGLTSTMALPLWNAVACARPTGEDLTSIATDPEEAIVLARDLGLPQTVIDRLRDGTRVPQERIDRTALADIRWWAIR
ncbi:hypothetical protein ACWEKR_08220 [Nocardia sp. NPDC004573]|uniref:hypothetical protein n=1 Tax=Nocardia sp. NPDC047038 TaxID=3154338 RepID=UPI0033D3417E